MAAQTLAPVEIPAGRPSSWASAWAVAKASSLVTWIDVVHDVEIEVFRDETGADALDHVRAGLEFLAGLA